MKIYIRPICFFAFLLMFYFNGWAQDSTKIAADRAAFETSYINEKNAQYLKAINKLKMVYDEKSYEINLRLGYLSYKNASYIESSKYYKKAIVLKPNSIEAKLGYILPLAALASWDTVKIQYENILKTDPNNSLVNYRMGLIYYYKTDYKSALSYFEKAYSLYPFDYNITLMYGWTNLKLNKYTEAKVLFNTVLLIEPNDASALEGLNTINKN